MLRSSAFPRHGPEYSGPLSSALGDNFKQLLYIESKKQPFPFSKFPKMKSMLSNILFSFLLLSCNTEPSTLPVENDEPDPQKIKYWYAGDAEISSYELTQARYGELRNGKAVLVFVTEPFSPVTNAKSDQEKKDDVSVLKLNFTKKFNTGVYPYSMMTSSFFPFDNGQHSLKISSSSQEWCGHTYMEMRNNPRKKEFEFNVNSYFEGETKNNFKTDKTLLEDDFWSMIRLSPDELPTGKQKVVPSFFYLRLLHKELKAYDCVLTMTKNQDKTNSYNISFPNLDRSTTIKFANEFPHSILSWEETYQSGFGSDRKELTTSGKLINTIKSDYWKRHSNKDLPLRKELGLD